MMMKDSKIKTLIVALFVGATLWAQDSVLVKEVTVSQEFNPTVNDAFKIGVSPKGDSPEAYKPSFEYSFFNAPLRTEYDIQFINASEYTPPEREPMGTQNYIKGGIGNYTTLLGELFYNAYNSEEQNVNIFYSNRSSWGDVTLENDKKVDAPLLSNFGKVDFQRRYRYSILNSSVKFNRLGYKYYGYSNMGAGAYEYADRDTVVSQTGKQTLTSVGFDLGLSSLERRGASLHYDVDFAFVTTSNNDKFSENEFDITAQLEKELQKFNIGFDAAVNVGFYGEAAPGIARSYVGKTFFGSRLAPYLSLEKKNWDLKLGANVELYQMDVTQEVLVSPLVDFNFNIVPKYFTGYVKAKGGMKQNTYAEVMAANPFVANDIERKATRTPIDVGGGIVGHPTKELSLKLGMDYKMIRDQLFFVNEFVDDGTVVGVSFVSSPVYTNRFVGEYDDNNQLTFHGEVNYDSHDKWSVSAAMEYYRYDLTTLPEAWHMPEYKIYAFGHYDLSEKIRLKGTFTFLPKRMVKVSNLDAVDELPVTYDLTLNGEYKFKENLSFFLDINNALGSNYHHFNGYPAYRFNALAGATFRF